MTEVRMNQEPPEKRFGWQETAQQTAQALAEGLGVGLGVGIVTETAKTIKAVVVSKLGHDPKPSEGEPKE